MKKDNPLTGLACAPNLLELLSKIYKYKPWCLIQKHRGIEKD